MREKLKTLRIPCFAGMIVFMMLAAFYPEKASALSLKEAMEAHKDLIITECREYGIWPSAVVGMAGVESGSESLSQLAANYNNYWGLTVSPVIGAKVPHGNVFGGFCAFGSFEDGLHAFLLWFWQGCYPGVTGVLRNLDSTPEQMYSAVISSGYMQQKNGYYEGIIAHARSVGADEWDDLAFPHGRKYVPYIEGMPDSVEVGRYDYPNDMYNTHTGVTRLLLDTPINSDHKIMIEKIVSEQSSGQSEIVRIANEQGFGEIAEEPKKLMTAME